MGEGRKASLMPVPAGSAKIASERLRSFCSERISGGARKTAGALQPHRCVRRPPPKSKAHFWRNPRNSPDGAPAGSAKIASERLRSFCSERIPGGARKGPLGVQQRIQQAVFLQALIAIEDLVEVDGLLTKVNSVGIRRIQALQHPQASKDTRHRRRAPKP